MFLEKWKLFCPVCCCCLLGSLGSHANFYFRGIFLRANAQINRRGLNGDKTHITTRGKIALKLPRRGYIKFHSLGGRGIYDM